MSFNAMTVRRATLDDAAIVAELIDGFARGHPAEAHLRSMERMREAFFGHPPVAHVLLAEKHGAPIGFGAWRRTYDAYWSMFGGEGIALYVRPSHRGFGVAACIVAAICSEIRESGGHFLQSTYDAKLARLYERVAIGGPERACHVSAKAFEALASLAGLPGREIVRALPDKALNYS